MLGQVDFSTFIDNYDGSYTDPISGTIWDGTGTILELGPIPDLTLGQVYSPATYLPATSGTVNPSASTGVADQSGTPINWGAILSGAIPIVLGVAGKFLGVSSLAVPTGYRPTTQAGTYIGPDGKLYNLNAQGQPVLATSQTLTGGGAGFGSIGLLALAGVVAFLVLKKK